MKLNYMCLENDIKLAPGKPNKHFIWTSLIQFYQKKTNECPNILVT